MEKVYAVMVRVYHEWHLTYIFASFRKAEEYVKKIENDIECYEILEKVVFE